MNTKITAMVNELFRSTLETAETAAMREELMDNCQEHYADLIAGGLSEEDALSAVADSLSGMKEIIDGYPRKETAPFDFIASSDRYGDDEDDDDEDEDDDEGNDSRPEGTPFSFQADGSILDKISISLSDRDVILRPATDGVVRVSSPDGAGLSAAVRGSTLRISPEETEAGQDSDREHSLGSILRRICRLSHALNSCSSDEPVTVTLPQSSAYTVFVSTSSGDVSIRGLSMRELTVNTVSGDVAAEQRTEALTLKTVSGDISLRGSWGDAKIDTVSGDILFNGDGTHGTMNLSSISGDMMGTFGSCGLSAISASTMSGDVTLTLPETVHAVCTLSSISGKTTSPLHGNPDGSPLPVTVSSVSGSVCVL